MPRFALLRHECPADSGKTSHWDLMLERDGVLRTWSLPALPAVWQAAADQAIVVERQSNEQEDQPFVVTRLADHRLEYLDYEGPISGDRGSVVRCDRGTYRTLSESTLLLQVVLEGVVAIGTLTLNRLEGETWRLTISPDACGR